MNDHEGLRLVGLKSTDTFASVSFATMNGRSMLLAGIQVDDGPDWIVEYMVLTDGLVTRDLAKERWRTRDEAAARLSVLLDPALERLVD